MVCCLGLVSCADDILVLGGGGRSHCGSANSERASQYLMAAASLKCQRASLSTAG